MDEHTKRQQATGHAVSTELYNKERLRQESQQKQEAAKSTFESVNKNGLPSKTHDQKEYDTTYKYLLGKNLEKNQGKPLDKETDAKIAKQIFDVNKGEEFDKVRHAIKEHSPLAARLPEERRHEYASLAAHKGLGLHLNNTGREEKTRVQTPHHETSKLQEMAEMHRHRERER
jgi:hypothetical protein